MKNILKRSISLALAAVMLCMGLSSCAAKIEKSDFYEQWSLKKTASFLSAQGNETSAKLSGTDGDFIDIVFPGETTVDTVVLNEKGDNITEYEIFVRRDGEFVSIYRQDKVGSFRYCAFPDTVTDAVRIKVNSTRSGSFNIQKIDVLNTKTSRDSFRVATYAVADRIYNPEKLDSAHFGVITDVILFGMVSFDEDGVLHYNDVKIDGETVSGADVLKKDIENLKAVKSGLKIYINILGPSGRQERLNCWLKKRRKKTSSHCLMISGS